MKVLLHINEENKWNMLLDNAKHMLESGENFMLEVVANGEAVKTLQKEIAIENNFYTSLLELSKKGVDFAACNNSINKFNINTNSLCKFVRIVPAGMVEVAKKEDSGYHYIKP